MPKYNHMSQGINNNELYKELLEDRGVKHIVHYRTKLFGSNAVPKRFSATKHVWTMGDRYFKLSYEYYGTYQYWWIIALVNNKPTEAHLEYGDVILIPTDPVSIDAEI